MEWQVCVLWRTAGNSEEIRSRQRKQVFPRVPPRIIFNKQYTICRRNLKQTHTCTIKRDRHRADGTLVIILMFNPVDVFLSLSFIQLKEPLHVAIRKITVYKITKSRGRIVCCVKCQVMGDEGTSDQEVSLRFLDWLTIHRLGAKGLIHFWNLSLHHMIHPNIEKKCHH